MDGWLRGAAFVMQRNAGLCKFEDKKFGDSKMRCTKSRSNGKAEQHSLPQVEQWKYREAHFISIKSVDGIDSFLYEWELMVLGLRTSSKYNSKLQTLCFSMLFYALLCFGLGPLCPLFAMSINSIVVLREDIILWTVFAFKYCSKQSVGTSKFQGKKWRKRRVLSMETDHKKLARSQKSPCHSEVRCYKPGTDHATVWERTIDEDTAWSG